MSVILMFLNSVGCAESLLYSKMHIQETTTTKWKMEKLFVFCSACTGFFENNLVKVCQSSNTQY